MSSCETVKGVGVVATTTAIGAPSGIRSLFSFPHPVNEYAARAVAAMVVTLSVVTIATGANWLLWVLAYGFLARVLTGPKLSPMGLLATRVIVPRVLKRTNLVAGPPKQFAQAVGLAFTTAALVLTFGFGLPTAGTAVLAVLAVFAGLEAFAGFCMGCFVFAYLIRWGLVPEGTCLRCANLSFAADPGV